MRFHGKNAYTYFNINFHKAFREMQTFYFTPEKYSISIQVLFCMCSIRYFWVTSLSPSYWIRFINIWVEKKLRIFIFSYQISSTFFKFDFFSSKFMRKFSKQKLKMTQATTHWLHISKLLCKKNAGAILKPLLISNE